VLTQIQPLDGFTYAEARLKTTAGKKEILVQIEADGRYRRRCGCCGQAAPGYDQPSDRRWLFVPLWAITVWLVYRAWRVNCQRCGIVQEGLPWNVGKRPVSIAMMVFLSRWSRHLSWRETARAFGTSWEAVFRSVEWIVSYGLSQRVLGRVRAVGIDEIHWGKGKKAESFLTVIYQIDAGVRRLLWVGPRRTRATLRAGFQSLGEEFMTGLEYVCSDMWKPYLREVGVLAGHAVHILDRFHVTALLNKAVDQVRRGESGRYRDQAKGKVLQKMRWNLLRNKNKVRGRARRQLDRLLATSLQTARAWQLKESFRHFWTYRSVPHAAAFLEAWLTKASRSRIKPMMKTSRSLRQHMGYLLAWFLAKGEISSGAVEGLNNKIRVVTRRSYGLRTYNAMQVALYHNLGKLPEPQLTHSFC
jgi:transposase